MSHDIRNIARCAAKRMEFAVDDHAHTQFIGRKGSGKRNFRTVRNLRQTFLRSINSETIRFVGDHQRRTALPFTATDINLAVHYTIVAVIVLCSLGEPRTSSPCSSVRRTDVI